MQVFVIVAMIVKVYEKLFVEPLVGMHTVGVSETACA